MNLSSIARITYTVLVEMLNHAQSINQLNLSQIVAYI